MIEEVKCIYEKRTIYDCSDDGRESMLLITSEQKEAIRRSGGAIVCTQAGVSDTIDANE